jgi:hypothetical protein
VELQAELHKKRDELMNKPKEYVKEQIRDLEAKEQAIKSELHLTENRLSEASRKLGKGEDPVERAYDVAEGRPDEDEDVEEPEDADESDRPAPVFDLKEYVRGAPHDLEVTKIAYQLICICAKMTLAARYSKTKRVLWKLGCAPSRWC